MNTYSKVILNIVAAGLLGFPNLGNATDRPAVMTLRQCMEYAVTNSADIMVADADIDDDRVARRDAILAAFTPYVGAGVQLYSNFGRSIDPESNTYVSTASFNNAYSVSASLVLFNGFEAVNNIRIAKTAQSIGYTQKQQEIDRICLATMEAYCNVLYFSELYEIISGQVQTAEQMLALARKQLELGQKGYADVVQVEADLADRKYQMIGARNSLDDALITLKDIMFWPIEDSLNIDTSVLGEDSAILLDEADVESLLDVAESVDPGVKIAKGNLDNASMALNTEKWKLAPSISISGGWGTSYYTYPGRAGYNAPAFWNQFSNNSGEYVQMTLSIPIFDRFSRHSEIRRKKNNVDRMQAQYDKAVREVRAEVHRAVRDRDGARAAFVLAESSASVSEEAWHLNMRKFEQGMISPVEYRTSSDNYLEARAKRLDAFLKYYIKRSVVSYYGGTPYINQEF